MPAPATGLNWRANVCRDGVGQAAKEETAGNIVVAASLGYRLWGFDCAGLRGWASTGMINRASTPLKRSVAAPMRWFIR